MERVVGSQANHLTGESYVWTSCSISKPSSQLSLPQLLIQTGEISKEQYNPALFSLSQTTGSLSAFQHIALWCSGNTED